MSAAHGAHTLKFLASVLRLRPSTTLFRIRWDAEFLSTARLFTQRHSTNLLMTQTRRPTTGALGGSGSSSRSLHVLHARQSEQQKSPNGQSLTFGFAFLAILLSLLFFSHLMQRVASRRQREVLERMTALQEEREREEVPKLWDVHLRRVRSRSGGSSSSSSTDGRRTGAGAGAGAGGKEESRDATRSTSGRLRWKDIQPLSARTVSSTSTTSPTDIPTPTEASHDRYDRPLRVAVLITMPVPESPTSLSKTSNRPRSSRRDSGKGFTDADTPELDCASDDTDTDRRILPYYELGVAIVK